MCLKKISILLLNRRVLSILPVLIYWPVLFYLTGMPIPELVCQAGVSDKTLHFLSYMILFFLLWFAVSSGSKANLRKAAVWWVFSVVVLYGAFDEWHQGLVGRNTDFWDFVANSAGVLTGIVIFSVFSFWPALLILTGTAIFLLTNLTKVDLSEFLPLIDVIFRVCAYAVFSLLWARNVSHFEWLKTSKIKWLMMVLSVPTGLLVSVELFSLIIGRGGFTARRICISIVSIAIAVGTIYLKSLFRRGVNTE